MMRLIHTFHDDREAKTFSSFLTQEGIENQLELSKVTDWGSSEYGDITGKIWIIDEDDMENAHLHLNNYLENPNDPKFQALKPKTPEILKAVTPEPEKKALNMMREKLPPMPKSRPLGPVTLYIIILCTLIFILSVISRKPFEPYPSKLPAAPLFSSNLEKNLYFDYPTAYDIIDKLVKAYGLDKVLNPNTLPSEGKVLLETYFKTPYWKGVYDKAVIFLRDSPEEVTWNAPLFEKEREGQVWRFFTPCFLHADLFHLFFNMIWLVVLGKQIERRLGMMRYLIFILLSGIVSNTGQYLMSGSNFIGFSGVICAMIVFVWVRQNKAPWEGYHLLPATMKFITGFVLILAGVQVISFILEVTGQIDFSVPIANTAHLTGALMGYILAQINYFSWKVSPIED